MDLLKGPRDTLRNGFQSLESSANTAHPIEQIQKNGDAEFRAKLDRIRRTQGSAMAMHLATEREMFNRPHRLAGLESSKIAYETISGKNNTIEFSDFLNDPSNRPDHPAIDFMRVNEMKHDVL
jgi:proteasome maturation protein